MSSRGGTQRLHLVLSLILKTSERGEKVQRGSRDLLGDVKTVSDGENLCTGGTLLRHVSSFHLIHLDNLFSKISSLLGRPVGKSCRYSDKEGERGIVEGKVCTKRSQMLNHLSVDI